MKTMRLLTLCLILLQNNVLWAGCPTITRSQVSSYSCAGLGELSGSFPNYPHMAYNRNTDLTSDALNGFAKDFGVKVAQGIASSAVGIVLTGGALAPIVMVNGVLLTAGRSKAVSVSLDTCSRMYKHYQFSKTPEAQLKVEGQESNKTPGQVSCSYPRLANGVGFKLTAVVHDIPFGCPQLSNNDLRAMEGKNTIQLQNTSWTIVGWSDKLAVNNAQYTYGTLEVTSPFKHTCTYIYTDEKKLQKLRENLANQKNNPPVAEPKEGATTAEEPSPEQVAQEILILNGQMVGGQETPRSYQSGFAPSQHANLPAQPQGNVCPDPVLSGPFDQAVTLFVKAIPNGEIGKKYFGFSQQKGLEEKFYTSAQFVFDGKPWQATLVSYNLEATYKQITNKLQELHSYAPSYTANEVKWTLVRPGGDEDREMALYSELKGSCIYLLQQVPAKTDPGILTRGFKPYNYAVLSLKNR